MSEITLNRSTKQLKIEFTDLIPDESQSPRELTEQDLLFVAGGIIPQGRITYAAGQPGDYAG